LGVQSASAVTTFLFTDIEGSTRLWEQEPERMSVALAQHDAFARTAVETHHGLLLKTTGDGIHAAFEDPLDAVAASLELQQKLTDLQATQGLALLVRCGLHLGIAERRDNEFFGTPVNRAARLMAAAHGGQVLLSQAVAGGIADRLGDDVTLRDLGVVRLRDLASPERVFQLVHPQLRAEFPPLRSLESTPNNLPHQLSSFVGRERELAKAKVLLKSTRLLTLLGVGGIGKTRLSLQVGADSVDDYRDGVWFIDFSSLLGDTSVLNAVAQVLGIRHEGGRPLLSTLCSHVADRRMLLILDNCEHVLDACARLADALLRMSAETKIIATSREPLEIEGEQTYPLPTLSLPEAGANVQTVGRSEAVQLFVERVRLQQPDFGLTEGRAPAMAALCAQLDGIPLALELAAARVPSLSIEEINVRLIDRFRLLTGGRRTAVPRQQTLRATLDWSHELLVGQERVLLRRLAVFRGGFTLAAATAVASDRRMDEFEVVDLLAHLVSRSLVVAESNATGARYRLLETTRAYALERLAEAGETQQTLRRHAEAVLAILEPLQDDPWQWRASGGPVPAARLELDNLRAALDWAASSVDGQALAVALAGVSYSVWWSAFSMAEGLARCLDLRPLVADSMPIELRARFWDTIGKLGLYSFRRESYEAALQAAMLYRALGDDQRRFDALIFAAVQGMRFASVAEMEAEIAEAVSLERPEWPARQRASLQFARCWCFARRGRVEEALACAQRQAAICRDGGVEVGSLYSVSNIAIMEVLLGRWQDALEHARVAIARLHALDTDTGAGHLYQTEMIALMMLDRLDEAWVAARNAYPRLLHEGDEYRMLLALALLNALSGRLDVAARATGFDDAIQARMGENSDVLAPLLHRRLDPLLAAGLLADERARLVAEGTRLREEDVFKQALSSDGDKA
jgi:predicted ATPase/class 3 adenylate cyclase